MRKLKKLAPSSSLRLLSFRGNLQRLSVALITLVMPLTAQTAWAWSGEGNEGSPYQISTVDDLIQLATDVNGGTTYEGFFFKLMNNIDFNDDALRKPTTVWYDDTSTEQNFPGIGGYNTANRTFNGTFNGNNKTISGIRIYSGGTDNTDKQRGLFGRIGSGGTVKNLTLSNARITGYTYTGGIAGRNFGKIDSCHVTNTVCIHTFISVVNDYHGGVAGENSNSTGIITNCTSSAKLTVKEGVTAGYCYGGIVGHNSTSGKLRKNFVSGATFPAAKGNSHGAIAGRNNDGTMTNNYYTGCTVAGTENASNVGCNGADVTTDNGAIGIRVLALGTNVTASGSTKEYNSTTYYYGTVTLGYSGTVPTGGIVKYAVNGDYISGNEFTISCDANVTAVVVYPYADISGLTYHGSTFDILGNTYFTSGSYYEINDEQDLIDLGDFIASNAANNCEGLTFKMTADLDFTNMPTRSVNGNSGNFHPIGLVEDASFDGCFSGHFDGQNHTIKALRYINNLAAGTINNAQVGLFKRVDGSSAVVERVILIDPQISGTNLGCGGIAGVIRNGATIRNCTVLGGSITRTGNGKSGGIVGSNASYTATIEGCTVIGTSVQNGIIIGFANSQQTIKDCIYYAPDGRGIAENTYTDGGGNQQVYQVTLGEGITAASPAFACGNKAYYAENATVTLGHTDRPGYVCGYQSSDVTISNGAFTMPASDVTVTTTWTPDPAHFADNGDGTYTIKTATGWDVFCDALQDNDTWNGFSGKTVKLGGDIGTAQDPITRMAGSDKHDFCGTFGGQGHTLNVNLNGAQYVAPFFYVKSLDNDHPATIQNLKVSGTVTGSDKFAAGIAGGCANVVNITNCLVDVTINSSVNGDGTHGGLVGVFDGGTLNITGCAFTGKLLSIGSGATTKCGGFVGYSHKNGTAVNITNSLYAPAALVGSETEPTSESMTFLRSTNTTVTITNSYYTRTLGDAQGTKAYELSAKPDLLDNGSGEGIVKIYDTYGLGFDNKYYLGTIPLSQENGISYLTTYLQGEEVPVEFKRSFTADKASTICLPFEYQPTSSEGTYYTFAGIKKDGNKYVATMEEANTAEGALTASTPHVFMPAATGEVTFNGVTTTIPAAYDPSMLTTTSGDWTFKGTYSKLIYGTEPFSGYVYGFASTTKTVGDEGEVQAGEFVHAKSGASVPSMRCYLKYKDGQQFTGAGARGMTRADENLPQTITVRFVDTRGEVTAIGTLNTQTGEIVTDGWYTLSGTKLAGKPTKKGLYIHDGKKVAIK